jgi:hypothetical protein
MYDLAKRSLAFTVATGGLLLTGTAYTPALAAAGVGPGANQGPAQAQGVQSDAGSASSPVNAASQADAAKAGSPARAVQAPPDLLAPNVLRPQLPVKPRVAGGTGPGAAATSSTKNSGGILSGNSLQIPINLGLDLCGNNANAATLHDTVGGGSCSSESGSSATSSVSHSGGIGSGNQVQVPINAPILACDNTVSALAAKDHTGGADCGTNGGPGTAGSAPSGPGGACATAVTDHSGGILSGNIVQAPVNVPVNACGNTVNAGVISSTESGSSCTNTAEGSSPTVPGAPAPGSGGASATAVSVDNGGIGSGMTVQTPINVPVDVCGNTADGAVAQSAVDGGVCSGPSGSATAVLGSTGNSGIVSGNSLQTPIQVPVDVCGNEVVGAADKLADANAACQDTGTPGTTPPGATAVNVSSNNGGIGSGNAAQTPINVPVTACENNVTAAGVHDVQGGGGCTVPGGGATSVNITSNNGGAGSGNTVNVPVNVPVNACGNEVQGAALEDTVGAATCAPTNVPTAPPTAPPTSPTTGPPTAPPTTPPTTIMPPPPPPPPTTPPPTKTPPPTTPPTAPPTTYMPPPPPPTSPPTAPNSTPPTSPTTIMPPPPRSTAPSTPPTSPSTPGHGPSTPPSGPNMPPGGPNQPGGNQPGHSGVSSANGHNGGSGLAHTGADIGIALGVAGAALLGGLGLRAAARKREGEE